MRSVICAIVQQCPRCAHTLEEAHDVVRYNVQKIIDVISSTSADILVFTELATSGYFYTDAALLDAVSLAVDAHELHAIEQAAKANNVVAVVGFPQKTPTGIYNSAVVLGADVDRTVYQKTHLFYKETLVFQPGTTGFVTVPLTALHCTIGIMICYDWRFPESARSLALKGADIIVCPSNLITNIWKSVMPARAIENKVYLAVANRYGTEQQGDESVSFNGCSAVYDYNGIVLAQSDAEGDDVLLVTLHPSETREKGFNAINNIFRDRRPDMYL
jgi:5-aminopentanamidase